MDALDAIRAFVSDIARLSFVNSYAKNPASGRQTVGGRTKKHVSNRDSLQARTCGLFAFLTLVMCHKPIMIALDS